MQNPNSNIQKELENIKNGYINIQANLSVIRKKQNTLYHKIVKEIDDANIDNIMAKINKIN